MARKAANWQHYAAGRSRQALPGGYWRRSVEADSFFVKQSVNFSKVKVELKPDLVPDAPFVQATGANRAHHLDVGTTSK